MLLIWWDGSSPKAPSCVVTFSPTCTYACFFFFFFFGLEEDAFWSLVYRGSFSECQIRESGSAQFPLFSYNTF